MFWNYLNLLWNPLKKPFHLLPPVSLLLTEVCATDCPSQWSCFFWRASVWALPGWALYLQEYELLRVCSWCCLSWLLQSPWVQHRNGSETSPAGAAGKHSCVYHSGPSSPHCCSLILVSCSPQTPCQAAGAVWKALLNPFTWGWLEVEGVWWEWIEEWQSWVTFYSVALYSISLFGLKTISVEKIPFLLPCCPATPFPLELFWWQEAFAGACAVFCGMFFLLSSGGLAVGSPPALSHPQRCCVCQWDGEHWLYLQNSAQWQLSAVLFQLENITRAETCTSLGPLQAALWVISL